MSGHSLRTMPTDPPAPGRPTRRVVTPDGYTLAVYETGAPEHPTVVLVHGYPDNHSVWDGVVAELADRFHVVTYDVRGAGASDQPSRRADYRLEHLTDDLRAVIDAVSPGTPVHLLAHDWGSIQAWSLVTTPDAAQRVRSFTSVSGPSLDHAGAWMSGLRRHPVAGVRQALESTYIGLFQVPKVPELLWRTGVIDRLLGGRGSSARRGPRLSAGRSLGDKINGLELYRANMIGRLGRPRPQRTEVPVQVIAPRGDSYVSPALQTEAPRPYTDTLFTREIPGGHWVVSSRPDVIARAFTELVEHVEHGGSARGLARAATSGPFAGALVLVTGGGSGIGRATALAFARAGADALVADIDLDAAEQTAAQVRELGREAHAHQLDVADTAQWEQFAATVAREHGTPDVIVNNAGIGMAGPMLDTGVADWERILGVNLWGVIHGCRLFGRQLVERGEGGTIVNVASAAAYAPSRTLPAYATTKAAVLMLSECLRAELAGAGIGVTAVCPGFIDTGITRSTVHVDADAAGQEDLRERSARSYRRRGYTAEKVAAQIVRAAAADRPQIAVSPEAKLLRGLGRHAPGLARRLARVDLRTLG